MLQMAGAALAVASQRPERESAKRAREYGVKRTLISVRPSRERHLRTRTRHRIHGELTGEARRLFPFRSMQRDAVRLLARKGRVDTVASKMRRMRIARSEVRDNGVRTGLGVDGSASNDGSNLLVEVREAMLLARLKIGLLPPEGPQTVLSTSDPLRAAEWMTARDALEIATIGGAQVLGRDDIGCCSRAVRGLLHARLNHVRTPGGLATGVGGRLLRATGVVTLSRGRSSSTTGDRNSTCNQCRGHNRNAPPAAAAVWPVLARCGVSSAASHRSL